MRNLLRNGQKEEILQLEFSGMNKNQESIP
jgi:hypothetical protein